MFYIWIEELAKDRQSMTVYSELQKAIDAAVMYENLGFTVKVRNAATGELAYG